MQVSAGQDSARRVHPRHLCVSCSCLYDALNDCYTHSVKYWTGLSMVGDQKELWVGEGEGYLGQAQPGLLPAAAV